MTLMEPQHKWWSASAAAISKFAGEAQPIAAVNRLVDDLLKTAAIDSPPVNLELPWQLRKIRRVQFVDMIEAGRLIPEDSAYNVEVNRRSNPARRRFTIAHEIGHTFFHQALGRTQIAADPSVGLFNIQQEEEYLCDCAAARLLLNPQWLHSMSLSRSASLQSLLEIAADCDASLESSAIQLVNLGTWSCSFIFWEPGLRKSQSTFKDQLVLLTDEFAPVPKEKLRATRVVSTPGLPFFPSNKSIDDDTRISQAYQEQTTTNGEEIFELGGRSHSVYCESTWAPFLDNSGKIRKRVISYVDWR